jgi:hypothetical protein
MKHSLLRKTLCGLIQGNHKQRAKSFLISGYEEPEGPLKMLLAYLLVAGEFFRGLLLQRLKMWKNISRQQCVFITF